MLVEQSFVAWVAQRSRRLPQVLLGIGDDAALLSASGRDWVVTTDSLCEGTHFLIDQAGPRRVGRKAASVNLSDLAAMAADPIALFLSLCIPRGGDPKFATEVVEGVCERAEEFGVALAGGDTNVWDGPWVIHVTAPEAGCWRRSGAKVGDRLLVTGTLGGSLLGKHLDFTPRLAVAKALRDEWKIDACMDLSDGLGIDLTRLCAASGVGAVVNLDRLPISDAAVEMALQSGRQPIDHALSDGEDFELLLAVPEAVAARLPATVEGVPLTEIGTFVARTGLWTKRGGTLHQLPATGYVHK
jgi:thiamine-monophosphate kinase